ncbi:hypothetical protein [Streptomyces sp. NPDC018947]|uniref:hypothetical protein n=1 Tax=Streptomyces sp. NPDC018947 TaxID=3365054 RepID=UPI0037B1CBE4
MRRFGLTTASAVILVLCISGCGGSDGEAGPAAAKREASASASSAGKRGEATAKSLKQVRDDLRFATRPHGDMNILDRPEGFCTEDAVVPTLKVLDRTAMNGIIERLKTRGWTPDGPLRMVSDNGADGSVTFLRSGQWRILLGAGPVPDEVKEAYAPNRGTLVLNTTWTCRRTTASPSPTM